MPESAALELSPAERQWRAALCLVLPLGVFAAPHFLALGDIPLCPFKALTGLPCPLCGGIRACAALAQGDLAAAWALNPGLLPLLLLVALHSAVLAAQALSGRRLWVTGRRAWAGLWGLAAVWLLLGWWLRLFAVL